jgi:phosphomannomutase/phosphoglucomutase
MLRDLPHTASTPEIRVACPDELKFRVVDRVAEAFRGKFEVVEVDGARILFPDGWGLVRASNTQPVIVMRFEAENSGALRRIRRKVEERLETILEDSGGS